MKKFLSTKKAQLVLATSALSSFVICASANAALPTEAAAAQAQVSTGITDSLAGAWPLIGAALAGGIVIKLVKRYTNKV